jgi:hypothetical protein
MRGAAGWATPAAAPGRATPVKYTRDIVKGIYPVLASVDVRRAWLCRRLDYLWAIKKPKTSDHIGIRIAQRRIALIEATRPRTATIWGSR